MAAVMEGTLWASWAPLSIRVIRSVVSNASRKITIAARPFSPAAWASSAARQPVHPSALSRQLHRRGPLISSSLSSSSPPLSTGPSFRALFRRFFSGDPTAAARPPLLHGSRHAATSHQWIGETFRNASRTSHRSPFASTLRPNLTGGTLPRSAGGYGLGAGGVRFFSHTPVPPAQVVQNVTQAMRAFIWSGQRARYDGMGANGEKRYRAVSLVEETAARQISSVPPFAPGAYIEFSLQPTITALSPTLASAFPFPAVSPDAPAGGAANSTLNSPDLLPFLAGDFERAARELSNVHADLRRLACLGDLPVVLPSPGVLRVRFPGVDADKVELLCADLGVCRGFVGEDDPALFSDDMGLRLPFAPDTTGPNKRHSSPSGSLRSLWGNDVGEADPTKEDDELLQEAYNRAMSWMSDPESSKTASCGNAGEKDEGLDGIFQFIEECNRARDGYDKR